jgi:hypothetical protein
VIKTSREMGLLPRHVSKRRSLSTQAASLMTRRRKKRK